MIKKEFVILFSFIVIGIVAGCKKESQGWLNAMLLETSATADEGDLVSVKKYIKKGADIDCVDEYTGLNPLLSTVLGNGERMKMYSDDPDSQRVLNRIREEESIKIARFLIEKGADKTATDSKGSNALHLAVYAGRPRMAAALLDLRFDVNAENKVGATPLIVAASSGSLETVKMLVEKGADIHHVTAENASALDIAEQYGHTEIVRYLESLGVTRSFNR